MRHPQSVKEDPLRYQSSCSGLDVAHHVPYLGLSAPVCWLGLPFSAFLSHISCVVPCLLIDLILVSVLTHVPDSMV